MLHLVPSLYTVVCNPPCENGACVANDTCSCSAGYVGARCNETGRSFCFARTYVHITLIPKYFKHLNSAGNSPFTVLTIVCKMADQNSFILPITTTPPSLLLAFIQVCDESPCGESENCGLQAGSYICVNCSTSEENPDDRCNYLESNPCIFGPCNNSICELRSNNTFACVCPPGYTGTTCEIPSKQYRVCVVV